MSSELESLKQRITELEAELEAKNSKLAEFEARDVKIYKLRKKVIEFEAKNAELIKQMMEENNRRDARIEDTTDRVTKLE